MRSRKFLICFIFVVVSLLSLSFNVKAGTYETSELIKVEGAQVRTSGNAGLRFVATETYEGAEETYGILLAFGEAEANESFVVDGTVNGKAVANAEIAASENGQYAVTLYDIPEVFYGQKVSARAYVKAGENYVYASTVTVRSLVEVAEVAYEAGNRTPFVENIYKTTNGIELGFDGGKFAAPYNFNATKLNGTATGYYITICTSENETAGSNMWWHRVYFKATGIENLWKVVAATKAGIDYPEVDYDYIIGIHQNIGLESETWAKAGEFVNLENATDYYAYFAAPTGEGPDVDVKIALSTNSTLLLGGKALLSEGEELPNVEKAGYEFNGWYDNAELTGEVVTTHVDATKYYASYTAVNYYISYEYGNGWPVDDYPPSEYTVESETIVLPGVDEMEFDGDGTFAGWYDNPLFTGEPITEIATGSYGDLTLYAKWISNESETIELSAADTAAIEALAPTKIVSEDVESGNYVVNGVTYAANVEAFSTLNAAIAAAVEGDKIYVFAGTYIGEDATITLANITIYGPNYGVAGKATRSDEAVISCVIYIKANNVTLNGLKHVSPISVAGDDITITNCYITPDSCLSGSGNNRKGCIADTAATTNLTISNCYINAPGTTHAISTQFLTLGSKATNLTLTGNYITNADCTATGSYTPAASRLYNVAGVLTISNNEFRWGTDGYLLYIVNSTSELTEANFIENVIDTNSNMSATAGIQVEKGSATLVTNYIGNVFKNCSGSTLLFKNDTGSTVNVKYNNFAAGTAFKVGAFGSANISFENNYYAESAYSTATNVTPTDFDTYTHDADGLAAYEVAYAAYKTEE